MPWMNRAGVFADTTSGTGFPPADAVVVVAGLTPAALAVFGGSADNTEEPPKRVSK